MPNYLTNAGDEAATPDLGSLVGANPPTVVTTPVKVGAKAIYVAAHGTNSSNQGTWTWPSPVQYQVARFWYRATAPGYPIDLGLGGAAERGDIAMAGSAYTDFFLDVRPNGVFGVRTNPGDGDLYLSPEGSYVIGTWYQIQLVWDCATNTFEFWVDGVLLYSYGTMTADGITSITYGALPTHYYWTPPSAYWDEIIVADGPLPVVGVAFRLVVS